MSGAAPSAALRGLTHGSSSRALRYPTSDASTRENVAGCARNLARKFMNVNWMFSVLSTGLVLGAGKSNRYHVNTWNL